MSKRKTITKKLELKDYYSPNRPHISRTQIMDYMKSPGFYRRKHIEKTIPFEITTPIQRGLLVDHVLTQGGKMAPFEVKNKEDKTQKDRLDPRFIVSESCYEEAKTIINEIKKHPFWKKGLKSASFQHVLEGKIDDVLVCGLPDRIDALGDGKYRMIDLKVTNPIKIDNVNKWFWNARESGYIHQAALYQYLFAEEQGIPRTNVTFYHAVAAYVDVGYAKVRLYQIPQSQIDVAFGEIRKTLWAIKDKKFDDVLFTWDDAEVFPDMYTDSDSLTMDDV